MTTLIDATQLAEQADSNRLADPPRARTQSPSVQPPLYCLASATVTHSPRCRNRSMMWPTETARTVRTDERTDARRISDGIHVVIRTRTVTGRSLVPTVHRRFRTFTIYGLFT